MMQINSHIFFDNDVAHNYRVYTNWNKIQNNSVAIGFKISRFLRQV